MQRWFLIFIVTMIAVLAGCSKHSAKEPDNQQNPPSSAASAPSSASTPAATPAPAAAPPATEAQAPAANKTPAAASETAATPAPAAAPAPKPVPPKPLVIPAGTTITVRTGEALGSKASQTGDTFTATVAEPVAVNGKVAIPASSSAVGTVVQAKAKGKVKGEAVLQLALKQITIKGHLYAIESSMSNSTQKGKGKRTAVTTGGGALVGGLIGGGKGAAIGAAAGFTGGALTGNKQIELPAESVLSFQLKKPLTLK